MMKKGQSFLEYAVLVGCIAITLVAMQTYLKRGIQGVIQSTSDDLGEPVLLATGRPAQQEGGRSRGWDYAAVPTVTNVDQEFLVNEYARGDRRFLINHDRTESTGGYEVTIPPVDYLGSRVAHSRDFNTAPVVAYQPKQSSSVNAVGGFGGNNGFGGGGANGRNGVSSAGSGVVGRGGITPVGGR